MQKFSIKQHLLASVICSAWSKSINISVEWIGCCFNLQLPAISSHSSTRMDIRMDMGKEGGNMEHGGRSNNRAG